MNENHDEHVHVDSECSPQFAPKKRKLWDRFKSASFFILSWFGFSSFLAASTTCPFCGQAGCPVGLGEAAGLGLISTVALWLGKKRAVKNKKAT